MAITIITQPSEWVAVKTPVVYKLARFDYALDAVNDSAGSAEAQIDGVDLTAYFEVGNTVIFQSSAGVSLQAEVVSRTFSGGNTLVVTDAVYATVIADGVDDNITNLSKRTDYRMEVDVFSGSESLTDGVVFSFTPDNTGVAYAQVQEIIKAFLKAEWANPSTLNETETDNHLTFFIKHQEYYDGALVGSPSDTGSNTRHAVFAALQIPSTVGNNLTDYVPGSGTKQFLTVFDRPKLWRDYPATLSFIYPDALAALYVYRAQYDAAGALINDDYGILDVANDDSVNRLKIWDGFGIDDNAKTLAVKLVLPGTLGAEILSNNSFVATIDPWTNEGAASVSWVWTAGDFLRAGYAPGNLQTKFLRQDHASQTRGFYTFVMNGIFSAGGQAAEFHVKAYLGAVLVTTIHSAGVGVTPWSITVSNLFIPSAFDRIEIDALITTSSVNSLDIQAASLKKAAEDDYTETLTFDIEDACDNPILLIWKNSLGGDAQWLFEHGQEAGYAYSGSKKAKRMTLFAEHLTLNQWEALNELNRLDEVHQENIVEFTSSVNKTAKRDSTQVYVVTTAGVRTGVIVIPTTALINTKDTLHQISVEIEFPERFE